jgi:hypothetical protein
VRAAATCDVLDGQISAALAAGEPIVGMKGLLDLRDRESRRLGALGSKLRLLPVSRYRPDHAPRRPPVGDSRPWREGA